MKCWTTPDDNCKPRFDFFDKKCLHCKEKARVYPQSADHKSELCKAFFFIKIIAKRSEDLEWRLPSVFIQKVEICMQPELSQPDLIILAKDRRESFSYTNN